MEGQRIGAVDPGKVRLALIGKVECDFASRVGYGSCVCSSCFSRGAAARRKCQLLSRPRSIPYFQQRYRFASGR